MKAITVVLISALAIMFVLAGVYIDKNIELEEVNNKLDTLKLIYSLDTTKANDYATQGSEYYDKASLSYEQEEWDNVVFYCEKARDKYLLASQEYKNLRAEIEYSEIEVVQSYAELLRLSSSLYTNLFEACEHFESAARYYRKYYLSPSYSDEISFDMGGNEIDNMNEKIREHDNNVEQYNTILARYNKQIKEYLSD